MASLRVLNRLEAFILFVGDLFIFYFSLWLTLVVRFGALPSRPVWATHAVPFSILFIAWFIVFFIGGLYEKHTTVLKSRLPTIVLNAQIVNGIIAVLFFFLIPYFGITPKTILFIYLVISFLLIVFWRQRVFPFLGLRKQEPAMLVGSGDEMEELKREVNNNGRYGFHFVLTIDLDELGDIDFEQEVIARVYEQEITTVVIDTHDERISPILPRLYNLIFSGVRFIDMHKVYESIFDRVPLSLVKYSWFIENISATRKYTYELLKRVMDILITLPLLALSLVVYPFVVLALVFDEGDGIFSYQERVGRNNKTVRLIKFRTMKLANDAGEWETRGKENYVTRVGEFLRKTRLDELPQLWNVLGGSISLIGPRPEFPGPVAHYTEQIPYYNVRHLVKPGLSGWAQVYHENHPHHGTDVAATKEKLSFDLYYIKNRSFFLDLKIALKTIKTLLSRSGK